MKMSETTSERVSDPDAETPANVSNRNTATEISAKSVPKMSAIVRSMVNLRRESDAIA